MYGFFIVLKLFLMVLKKLLTFIDFFCTLCLHLMFKCFLSSVGATRKENIPVCMFLAKAGSGYDQEEFTLPTGKTTTIVERNKM